MLPKYDRPHVIYPNGANATGQVAGVSGALAAAHAVLTSSTANPYIVQGAVIGVLMQETAASIDQAINGQINFYSGAAASEVLFDTTTFSLHTRFDFVTGALGRLSFSAYRPLLPKEFPASTRITYKSAVLGTKAVTFSIYLIGYEPSSGYALIRPYPQPDRYLKGLAYKSGQKAYADLAMTNVTAGGAPAWTIGAWTTLIAGAAERLLLTGYDNGTVSSARNHQSEIGISFDTGSTYQTQDVMAHPGVTGPATPIPGSKDFPRPLIIPKGAYVGVRTKAGTASSVLPVQLIGSEIF